MQELMLAKSRKLELGCERVGELIESHRPGSPHHVTERMIPTSGLALTRCCWRLWAFEDEGCAGCQPVPVAAERSGCFLPALGLSLTVQLGARPAVPRSGAGVALSGVCSSSKGAGSSVSLTKGDPKPGLGLLELLISPFFLPSPQVMLPVLLLRQVPSRTTRWLGQSITDSRLPTTGRH